MISPNITNKGGLNYILVKTLCSCLLFNIIAIAVTVYLVYLFIYLFVLYIYYIIFY